MESYLSEEALWASGLASRLRLIQANCADDSSSVKRGITEEIERALKPVSPTRRKIYLIRCGTFSSPGSSVLSPAATSRSEVLRLHRRNWWRV
jgi:hypothetical protein